MREWLSSDLSELDLPVIQIDGLHVGNHVLVAAIGVDGNGGKPGLAVAEGATENMVTVQALLDNVMDGGLEQRLLRAPFMKYESRAFTRVSKDFGHGRCGIFHLKAVLDGRETR